MTKTWNRSLANGYAHRSASSTSTGRESSRASSPARSRPGWNRVRRCVVIQYRTKRRSGRTGASLRTRIRSRGTGIGLDVVPEHELLGIGVEVDLSAQVRDAVL